MSLTTKERAILEKITIGSDSNPKRPEFPPHNPQFPATPTVKIEVPGFSNVWLKDESKNPTGTHKDRMAWEVVVTYRDILAARERKQSKEPLPSMSIISSGSAAVAIQTMLRTYDLPNLKTLVDIRTDKDIIRQLKQLGCEVYTVDLSERMLSARDILKLTNNENGLDLTSSEALDPNHRFYDWLSYEILNNSPEYCFVPFGTGMVFENLLNVARREISCIEPDPRFRGDLDVIRNCHYFGATTSNPETKAIKLYSPHLPFSHFNDEWLRFYRYSGFCADDSGVYQVQEELLDEAMDMAAEQGIACEASGISGLALLLQMQQDIPKDAKIVIVNTGKVKA